MRRNLAVLLALVAVAVCWPAGAEATPVVVLGHDGHASVRNDPYLSASPLTPVPAARTGPGRRRPGSPSARVARAGRGRRRSAPQITFYSALRGLYHRGRIDLSAYSAAAGSFRAALGAERHLGGTRLSELRSVTETMHTIAVSHKLTPSRLPAIEATLDANRQWWTTGPLLAPDQRVEFAGSQLVWEYYPGQGIQLQILGTFGKADGLYTAGPSQYPQLEQLLSEVIPLASRRGGGLTWEYWFDWDGGRPPWTSAMSQATGLEALTRAYEASKNPYYLSVATQALPIFSRPPPAGVAVKTRLGVRFIQYTFTPGTAIINAFLQTLVGLYDFSHVSGNQTAASLFAAGNAEAQAEVPSFNTGAWSLYQPGLEDDLSYHELVTGFLQELCQRTSAPVYCTTAQEFEADLKTPPVVRQRTFRAVAETPFDLRFQLSKYSHVGVIVSLGARTVFATSASFAYGLGGFSIPGIRAAGTYSVRLAATDLAGNFSRSTGTLVVRPRVRGRRGRGHGHHLSPSRSPSSTSSGSTGSASSGSGGAGPTT